MIFIGNAGVEIGILNEAGGRIVMLKKSGSENMLKSHPELWNETETQKPAISPFTDFKAFDGHITWVGPQCNWWTQQKLNTERAIKKADWPPDPYLIYGSYQVIEKSDSSIQLTGPASPISGVQFRKNILVDKYGQVHIKTIAENIRKENVEWDLWMLTRLDGFAKAYVPIEENGILELKKTSTDILEPTPYKTINNYFTFEPSVPQNSKLEQVQEVHLNPSAGYMAGFVGSKMLLIRFEKIDKEFIHFKHGQVELYSSINKEGNKRLLELEVHSAYKSLRPGETIELSETWKLFEYKGLEIALEQIDFLESIISKRL